MDFEIPQTLANLLLDRIARDSALARQLGEHGAMRGRTIVSSALFDDDALGALADCCRENGNRSLMLQVSALKEILVARGVPIRPAVRSPLRPLAPEEREIALDAARRVGAL